MTGARVRDLHRELQECQRRLGTSAESEADFERVLSLAHEINNQVSAAYLQLAAEAPPQSPPSLLTLCRQWLKR